MGAKTLSGSQIRQTDGKQHDNPLLLPIQEESEAQGQFKQISNQIALHARHGELKWREFVTPRRRGRYRIFAI
jgi:hypothetical protein